MNTRALLGKAMEIHTPLQKPMLSGSYFLFGCSFALIHSMFLIASKYFLRIEKIKKLL
jgi:hypothetical protein